MRERILEILQDQRPDVDFENETELVSGKILESFDIVSIVSELDDEFDIEITPKDLKAENFDSLEALENLIERLSEE
ncbi:Phosphopantetheine attachment site [Lachnospiraceae bacterium KH1T2]|nr:Phosphopantetheine attachment site [Lachnospiraceae bacterium KH1T2]